MARPRFQLFTIGSPEVWWRLMSANNRDLGRAGAPLGGAQACAAAVRALQDELDLLVGSVHPDDSGSWRWQLARGSEPWAVTSRAYLRSVECRSALSSFLRAAAVADLSLEVRAFPAARVPAPRRAVDAEAPA